MILMKIATNFHVTLHEKKTTCENWIRPNDILICLPFLLLNGRRCLGGMNEILSQCAYLCYIDHYIQSFLRPKYLDVI